MSRIKARKTATLIVYSQIFNLPYTNDSLVAPLEIVYNFDVFNQETYSDEIKEDKEFIDYIVNGVSTNIKHIDSIISKYLVNWTIKKISKVDLAILRVATFEILYSHDVPDSVIISEAVQTTSEFSEQKSVSFVNGILSTISKAEVK